MIPPAWAAELERIAVGAVVLLSVGWLIGQVWLVLLAGALGYGALNLYHAYRLNAWLATRRREDPPPAIGIWAEVQRNLLWMLRQSHNRIQRLADRVGRFQQASAALPDAAVALHADGDIEWLNTASTKLLGLESQDLGKPITDFVRAPEFARYLMARRFEEPIEIPSPLAPEVTLSVRVIPYGGDRRLLLARDVSRIHRLEGVRRDFVANVSHELRSPLTVIRGYTETLLDSGEAVPGQWRKPLQQIEQQTNRMCRIVDDLLHLSRLESNPEAATMTLISVAEMLEAIRNDARGLMTERHDIRIEADPQVKLAGEYNELYSAFSNLVFNAVQYTPNGGEIVIAWYADGAGAHLSVADRGVGIEGEHIERLTERFYRVDKARSRAVGGTGLGLAIVKHVLMRHQAQLRIESVLGEGSTFFCDFPRERSLLPAPASRDSAGL